MLGERNSFFRTPFPEVFQANSTFPFVRAVEAPGMFTATVDKYLSGRIVKRIINW